MLISVSEKYELEIFLRGLLDYEFTQLVICKTISNRNAKVV